MVGFYGGAPLEYAGVAAQGSDAVPASTSEVLGAQFGSTLAGNPIPRILRGVQRSAAETGIIGADDFGNPIQVAPEPSVDPAPLNEQYGIPGHLKFDQPLPDSSARDLYEHKRDELIRQDVIARREGGVSTGMAARFGVGLIAGLLDPVNLAAGLVPVVGEARIATMLGRGAVEAMGAAELAGVRVVAGGVSGGAAMAALQPVEFALSRAEREDYTMADALRNVAFGAVLGGGLHVIGGAIADRVTGRYANPITQRVEEQPPEVRQEVLQGALAQHIADEPTNVAPALDLADALKAEQDLGVFVRQQQRLSAESDRVVAAAATAENQAARAAAQTEAASTRLAGLRAQAEATRAELAQIRGGIDTVTPVRLQEIDWELAAPALTTARRGELEAERRLLTEGSPALDQARTEAQASGVEAALARQERQIARAESGLAQREPPVSGEPAFNARVRVLGAQQQILQATVEREIRRIAGRSGITLPPDEVTSMATRVLGASPQTAREAIWPILGDIANRRGGAPIEATPDADVAGIAASVVDDLRQRQTQAVGELAPRPAAADETTIAAHEPIPAGEMTLPDIEREIATLEASQGMPPPSPAVAAGERVPAEPAVAPPGETRAPVAAGRPAELVAADAEIETANARAAAFERAAKCIIGGG